ncbi:MAG: flagellar assembly protein FliH [Spirochaetales bacterium]|nr:flagellar assembly protein FliH [Spirochaetales bacterium]
MEEMPEYTGPTADDLRREAEAFRESWDREKSGMIEKANAEAAGIVSDAEARAFEEVKRKTDEAQQAKQQAEDEAARTVQDAESRSAQLIADAQDRASEINEAARKEGYGNGREEGYQTGTEEVDRLVKQVHSVIDHAIEKRNEIIEESETQVINLVLLIAKKVVKVISENQKNVVINNVIQSLRKLKSRGEVIIRVNLEDVKLTSDHVKDFTRMVDSVGSVTVVEDSSVDKGGCIIETDFGQIDGRISSQLHEIEEKILELAPIRVRGEG